MGLRCSLNDRVEQRSLLKSLLSHVAKLYLKSYDAHQLSNRISYRRRSVKELYTIIEKEKQLTLASARTDRTLVIGPL